MVGKKRETMTVKDVFELRKQGRIEEAYEAIRPMYAVHQGKYTTLCMFWTASDILKKRIQEKRIPEAEAIFKALLRVQPNIDDRDGKVQTAMLSHALRLSDEPSSTFSMLDFIESLPVEALATAHWQGGMSQDGKHALPSTAQRMLTRAFHEIQEQMYGDYITKKKPVSHDQLLSSTLKAMPLLQEAARHYPHDKHTQRYMAIVYTIMGEREKAAAIYRSLLARHHDSYLYAELADLTDAPGPRAALLCQAIMNQRQEKFRISYRLALARMLMGNEKSVHLAAHELQKCITTRKAIGLAVGHELEQLAATVQNIAPATDDQQQDFYRRMAAKYPV